MLQDQKKCLESLMKLVWRIFCYVSMNKEMHLKLITNHARDWCFIWTIQYSRNLVHNTIFFWSVALSGLKEFFNNLNFHKKKILQLISSFMKAKRTSTVNFISHSNMSSEVAALERVVFAKQRIQPFSSYWKVQPTILQSPNFFKCSIWYLHIEEHSGEK